MWGVKKTGKFLWFESTTVTSQALKMTSLNFVSMQFYAMFYKASTTLYYLYYTYATLA